MLDNDAKAHGSVSPDLLEVLRAALESCPHGLKLSASDQLLFENAAWARMAQRQDGDASPVREVQTTSFELSVSGLPLQATVAQDITERKRLEDQLHEAQRLEALGRWVGGIVHDFRNVLTAVMLYSDLVAQHLETGGTAAKYNDEVREAAARGASLVSQLLSFARRRAAEPTAMSLNSLVTGIHDVLRRMMGEDVEVILDLCEAACTVRMDPTQMQQVVFNLAVNARDAMPQGGRVVLRTVQSGKHSTVGSENAPCVELVVSDNGAGMDATTLARAFEAFYTTKAKGMGTGLGLTTVQSIVTQAGGTVSIESEPGRGTTVTVLLPSAEAEKKRAVRRVDQDIPRGSETVLLVEDESAVRASIRELLRSCGYTAMEAGGGPEAIRIAREYSGNIDLLLCDMVLPGLSGREIARRIRESRPEIQVLFMSGYEAEEGTPEQDWAVFTKPFNKCALARKVRQVLDCRAVGPAGR